MRTKMFAIRLAAACCTAVFFPGCGSHPSDPNALGADFTLIPMERYPVDSSAIRQGSPVSILAYSGGKRMADDKVYYSQFIVIDRSTGDTTRILSAFIAIDSAEGSTGEYLSPADAFDGEKHLLDATFEKVDVNYRLLLSAMASVKGDGSPDAKKLEAGMADTASLKEFVLVNRNANIFAGKYKTAKGVLRFHSQPW